MRGPADVEALCAVMHKYGLTRLKSGSIELERPPFAVGALPAPYAKRDEADDEPDDLDKLRGMSPDAVDRMLTLNPLGPA